MGVELGVPMSELARMPSAARHAPLRARRASPHQRYMAFLSYSHDDEKDAAWLEESLETFRVPPRLVGQLTDMGPVPKKLTPIFRDRHELAAAADLGEEIEEAIAGSRFLIVLCSRTAAQSHWINEEIALFKRLHEDDRVLAVILDGEPFASDDPDRAADECFPLALRTRFDSRGRATSQRAEPLAADLREAGDGRRMGLLKTIAGMLGVGLDELAQREAHRRQRRMMMITAASVAGMLATSGLAYTAIQARDEARDQRREAEGLIGFMLGDLRNKLEPIGRLDALDGVGARALAYYEKQNKTDMSDAALAQRSRALTLMGEIAQLRGDLDGALARYREARAGTAEMVRRSRNDPQRLFEHAQNAFWVGTIALQRGQIDGAEMAFRDYQRLATRMVAIEPGNPKWRMETQYADANVGIVLYEQRRYPEASRQFQRALTTIEQFAAKQPANASYQQSVAESLAWLADSEKGEGRLDEAIANRQRQVELLSRLMKSGGSDVAYPQRLIPAHKALGMLLASRGETAAGERQMRLAVTYAEQLIPSEPDNMKWVEYAAGARLELANLLLATGRMADASAQTQTACAQANQLIRRDPNVAGWRLLVHSCLMSRGRLAFAAGSRNEALSLAIQALTVARSIESTDPSEDRYNAARTELLIGDIRQRMGQRQPAMAAWQAGLAGLPRSVAEQPSEMSDRALLLQRVGRPKEASSVYAQLDQIGFRHPAYLRARQFIQ